MVCIYCAGRTQVVNSRPQKQANQVWRRRQCTECRAIFTTQEAAELSNGLAVRTSHNKLQPFFREKLFISIYESCKHRADATSDATALTQTVINQLLRMHEAGALALEDIAATTHAVLERFDATAATVYRAYHAG